MSNPNDISVHERIRQEHEELRALLAEVHRTLAKRQDSVADVAEMLQLLRRRLRSHFDDEEVGGFFDDIRSQAPRLSERADALQDEHTWLNSAIGELIECANAECDDWWRRLETKFHEFSKQLMHHESKENELLLEAYGDDIGSAD